MAPKMHAAVVEQFGKPLSLLELDVPSPGAGQILVKTEACGVCHTDLHAAHGDWPVKPTLPFIPGHEAIGLVAALGSGAKIVKEGDRVGVPWLYSAWGHCEYCLTGLVATRYMETSAYTWRLKSAYTPTLAACPPRLLIMGLAGPLIACGDV